MKVTTFPAADAEDEGLATEGVSIRVTIDAPSCLHDCGALPATGGSADILWPSVALLLIVIGTWLVRGHRKRPFIPTTSLSRRATTRPPASSPNDRP